MKPLTKKIALMAVSVMLSGATLLGSASVALAQNNQNNQPNFNRNFFSFFRAELRTFLNNFRNFNFHFGNHDHDGDDDDGYGHHGQRREIEGKVTAKGANSFDVRQGNTTYHILVDSNTEFKHTTFATLAVGDRVHVKAETTATPGTFRADQVNKQH